MRCYFAKHDNEIFSGGWLTVIHWAKLRINSNTDLIKIFTCRPEDKYARVIAELSLKGERYFKGGRLVSLKALLNGKF